MAIRQVRSVVVRVDGPAYHTDWYAEGDPVVVDALTELLRQHTPRAYVVQWETRDVEGAAPSR
jgi:hypothetical protein